MKAKVIREPYRLANLNMGDIVEIVPGMETDAEGIWNVPAGKLVLCKKEDGTFTYASLLDMEIIDYHSVDWADFRREAAKAAMQGILASGADGWSLTLAEGYKPEEKHSYPIGIARFAIACTDELIKQLKEERI